jgi:hypothetical protein
MTVWIALAFCLAGIVAGLLYAVLRGLAAWRQVKRTSGAVGAESARIAEVSEQIQVHLDRASASSDRLRAAGDRLAVSRAKLDVQLQAVREARQAMRRLLWFLPGT